MPFFFGYRVVMEGERRHTRWITPMHCRLRFAGWRRKMAVWPAGLGRTFLSGRARCGRARIDGLVARVRAMTGRRLIFVKPANQRHALGAGAFARGPIRAKI